MQRALRRKMAKTVKTTTGKKFTFKMPKHNNASLKTTAVKC